MISPPALTGRMITTIAGKVGYGNDGDGGLSIDSHLNSPSNVAVDSTGNLYIVDNGNNRIRKILKSDSKIYAFAGTGGYGFIGDGSAATAAMLGSPCGIAVDNNSNVSGPV